MFYNLKKITKIDLRNLDFVLITDLESFFEGCTSLTTVDFSNINAINVVNMNKMLKNCTISESANFNKFSSKQNTRFDTNVLWL